jgi:ABC-type sugar transport system substrate-binding protein
MSMKKLLAAMALVLAFAMVVAACGSSDSSSPSESSGSSEATTTETEETEGGESEGSEETTKGPGGGPAGKTIYYVGVGDVNPWSKAFNHGVMEPLEEEGADVTYLQDPFNPQVQVENLNRAIAAKPDMIILLGLDYPSLVPGLTRAKAAGIPVFNMSSPATPAEELVTASIESNHTELGEFAAENLIEGLEGEGKAEGNVIAITGTAGLSQVQVRMEGFEKVLAEKAPGLKLVAVKDGNWDQATSQKLASQLFAQYQSKGGVQAAYGMADNQALGVIQAATEAGMEVGGKEGLIVSGSNCFQVGLEAIEAGELFGTATQSPYTESEFASAEIIKWLEGEEIPVRSFTPEERVTAANVKQISKEGLCP